MKTETVSAAPPFARWTWRAAFCAAAATVLRWYDRAGQRRALAKLDPRQLADIGLTAEAARQESRKRFWEA